MPDGSEARPGPKDPLFGYRERFASVLVAAGFPPMPARVFVALLVTDSGRLTAAELADVLQVSPAAVSGAVRYLAQLALVHKERVPGSRRDYYRMPDDVWSDMFRLRDGVMQRWAALVREGIDLLGPDTPAGERLAEHATFFDFVSREMPEVLKRWDEYRAGNTPLAVAVQACGTWSSGSVNSPPRYRSTGSVHGSGWPLFAMISAA